MVKNQEANSVTNKSSPTSTFGKRPIQVTIVPVDQFPVPESFGITVSSGTVAKVAVRKEIVERLGGKFGPCITSFPTELSVPNSIREQWPYSSEICDLFCIQTKLWDHCKCVDNFIGLQKNSCKS